MSKQGVSRSQKPLTVILVGIVLVIGGIFLYRQMLAGPLLKAISEQNETEVARLLRRGASPNATDENGRTALSSALDLLSHGNGSHSGSTAFMRFTRQSSQSKVPQASPLALPSQPPLQTLAVPSERIALLLLNAGADANGSSGNKPILQIAIEDGSLPSVQSLLKHGANPNAKFVGTPVLMAAVQEDQSLLRSRMETEPVFTQSLLSAGANPNLHGPHVDASVNDTFSYYELPLTAAAFDGDVALVETLLAHGANVNGQDHAGRTALFTAVKSFPRPAVVRVLLAHGAHTTGVDWQGDTALDVMQQDDIKNQAAQARWQTKLAAAQGTQKAAMLREHNQYRQYEAAAKVRHDEVKRLLVTAASSPDH